MKWISEGEALPAIAQNVLVATPRQSGEFWDIVVACILVRHEGVVPQPVSPGARWPVDFYWGFARRPNDNFIVTGNGWWASMTEIDLPPGAEHQQIRGFDCIAQLGHVFVQQSADSTQKSE